MDKKFELIETFSRRPSLSSVALTLMTDEMKSQYPVLKIDPDVAVVTQASPTQSEQPGRIKGRTLSACLQASFASGKTTVWTNDQNTLVANPGASTPVVVNIDMASLAVSIDSLALGLSQAYMKALVKFWSTPDKSGRSPWEQLARALERQKLASTPGGDVEAADAVDPYFEKKALNVLRAQLSVIESLRPADRGDFDEIEGYLAKVTDITPLFNSSDKAGSGAGLTRLDQLPGWLQSASAGERLDYSRRMEKLAIASVRAAGQSWNDDLPPLLDYARKALQDGLLEDHPEATGLTLDDVTVHIAKVVAAALPSAGQIIATGSVEKVSMSVATFALGNLASLPNGTITLSVRDGGPIPVWLTPEYLKSLMVRLDLGCAYPELVRRYLVTDQGEAARRQILFADQLSVQLPLKALEQKIRGQGNLTQAGYRCVCALLDTDDTTLPADSGPVLRPLAWVAEPGFTADPVGNMFIIGDADPQNGPFILYRPFAETPLSEFPSWQQLRDAIAKPGDLQDDVLVWMSDAARQRYANNGFDQPHTTRFGLGSDFAPIQTPPPAQLESDWFHDDPMQTFFDANAQALVDLADRESLTNAESRWAMFQRGGWLALDVVLPFLSGAVANAVWLMQMMLAVDHVLVAERRKTGRDRAEAWNSLLLTISMILLHQGFPRGLVSPDRSATAEPTETSQVTSEAGPAPVPDGPATVVVEPPLQIDIFPAPAQGEHLASLDFSWASSQRHLTVKQATKLAGMRMSPEPVLKTASVQPGKEGLYLHEQKWLVKLEFFGADAVSIGFGEGVFEVSVTDEAVCIVDPQRPASPGPQLRKEDQGWSLDLSPRLLGGGPQKRSLRQMALENAATLKRVQERTAILQQSEDRIYAHFNEWDKTLRREQAPFDAQTIGLMEIDLKALCAIIEENAKLQQSLRAADRASEKVVATAYQGLTRRMGFVEGVLLNKATHTVNSRLPQLHESAEGIVKASNIDAYLQMFEDLLDIQDKGADWSASREQYMQQLREVPKVGENLWRSEQTDLQNHNLLHHLEWRIYRMWSLLELSFTRSDILAGYGDQALKGLRMDERLHAAFSSQAELEKPNDYAPADQISVLESSLREYERGSLVAASAKESHAQTLVTEYFERFLEDLAWLTERAEARLSDLIRESAEPSQSYPEYVPKVKQVRKRIFKTRGHRTLVGKLREGEPELSGSVVDVIDARDEKVISTYHLHDDGEWVEVEDPAPTPPVKVESIATLAQLKSQANVALERIEAEIGAVKRQSGRGVEPADVQDMLVHKADKLRLLADRLAADRSGTAQGSGESNNLPGSTQALITGLRQAADRMVQEGRALRVSLIKAQPPTGARLDYLATEREISIARFEGRKNMSGKKRDDFLQEYVIRDKDARVLWWAHFHYASESAPATAYTAAHLKMPEQRFIGYKAQVKAATDNKGVINVYRSVIGKDVAQRLFLNVTPQAPGDDG